MNQIGTLTETLDAIALAQLAGYRPSSRTAPARPRTRRSPTSRSRPAPARSRPARRRARTASRSTTSSCGSRRSSASAAAYPGLVGVPAPRSLASRELLSEAWPRAAELHAARRSSPRSAPPRPGGSTSSSQRGHGRRPAQLLPRHARRARAQRATLVREAQDGARPAARADRRPPGPEAPRRPTSPEPLVLARGEEVVIGPDGDTRPDVDLPVSPAVIGEVLAPGHDVLIDDGHVRLRVDAGRAAARVCTVVVGGVVSSHKGVNLPGVPLPIPSLTPKDLDDLAFALELGVDYVALSFVRSADDVRDLRRRDRGGRLARARDREDREGRGGRRARRRSSPSPTPSWSRAATSASRSAPRSCRCCRSG